MKILVGVIAVICCAGLCAGDYPCSKRAEKYGVVCVCNATYCDAVHPTMAGELANKNVRYYVSSNGGDRMTLMLTKVASAVSKATTSTILVDTTRKYQAMMGFGGTTTDSAAFNVKSLSAKTQEMLLRQYFASGGIEYTFVRVPVGGTDQSSRKYALMSDHVGDTQLKNFDLAPEDYKYKIPVLKSALQLNKNLKLFSAPWSAPDWMKHIDTKTDASYLLPQYYEPWAKIYTKFFEYYKKEGINFWAYTPQNEPTHGLTNGGFNSMGWQAEQLLSWTLGHLVPNLKSAGFSGLELMVLDDQRSWVPSWTKVFFSNSTIRNLAKGTAVHWYSDTTTKATVLTQAHDAYPEKFLLYTEACSGSYAKGDILLGSWDRAALYASDIIANINHWVAGWVEWNIAVNFDGGPAWYGNSADSSIVVDASKDIFYKQPMFYVMAAFSKFVRPGAVHVGAAVKGDTANIETCAFVNTDGVKVVIVHSKSSAAEAITISDHAFGHININIPAKSLTTVLYK